MSDFFSGDGGKVDNPLKKVNDRKNEAKKWFSNNHNLLFIILFIIIAVVVIFVSDFTLNGSIGKKAFSVSTIFLIGVAYMIFVEGYSAGGKNGEKSEFVIQINDYHTRQIETIRERKLGHLLPDFLKNYVKNERENAQLEIISPYNLTLCDIEKFNKGEGDYNEIQEKALSKALKIQPIKLNEDIVVMAFERPRRRSQAQLKWKKVFRFIFEAVRLCVTSAFVVSLTIDIIADFSTKRLIKTLIELIVLLSALSRGLKFGFKSKIELAEQKKDISRILDKFIEDCDEIY